MESRRERRRVVNEEGRAARDRVKEEGDDEDEERGGLSAGISG